MKIVLYGDGVTTYLDFDNPNPWGEDLRGEVCPGTTGSIGRKVLEHARIPLGRPNGVIVIPQDRGCLVMVWSRKRAGWEFPGGHIEEGEGLLDTARRECLEEAGIRIEKVTPWCSYLVIRHRPGLGHAPESRGVIARAQVADFERFIPTREIGRVGRFRRVPDKVTFRDGFIEEVFRLLNKGS